MTDVFARMGELLSNVDKIKEKEAEQLAAQRKKKKVKRKKKKAVADGSGHDSSSPSRTASPERPYYTHHTFVEGQPYTASAGAAAYDYIPSPSSRKDAYHSTGRPRSAMPASPMPDVTGIPSCLPARLANSPGSPGFSTASPKRRPMSAAARLHGGGAARPTSASAMAGPSARAHADAVWRDVSPPKYTATSLKQPELGSVPGKYQSPPWSPLAAPDKDPARQELDMSVKEERFQHILAVPAHVLAQSFYHPSCPSDRARAKQLAADLKTARMDRSLVMKEKVVLEKQLVGAQSELQGLKASVRHLQSHSQALQDRLADVLQANKQLHMERALFEDRLRHYEASLGVKGADLMQQLVAAKQEIAVLNQQLATHCSAGDAGYQEE